MGMLHFVGGSRYRIPQTEFWNERGVYESHHHQIVSGEKVHASVRYLTLANLVKPCPSLAGINPQRDNTEYLWGLLPRAESWIKRLLSRAAPNQLQGNIMHEEEFGEFERNMLDAWVDYERRVLDDMTHPPGEPAPDTILIHLKTWLENYMENPEPIPVD
jgi:hypothetical protein